jgi:hypothetical protein
MAEAGECRFAASVVTPQEAILAPAKVVRPFARTFPGDAALLERSPRADELAQAYRAAGVVSARYIDDARHVAIATTHGIGVLVTWTSGIWPTTVVRRGSIGSTWRMAIPRFASSAPWRLSMKAKTKEFDAVAESRRWKEAVAKETEGMTPEERIAYFNRTAVRRRFEAALRQAEQADKNETQ